MGTLNLNLFTKDTQTVLIAAAGLMPGLGRQTLTPEILLLALLRQPGTAAKRILDRFAESRGFRLADVEREVEGQARLREGKGVDFDLPLDERKRVPLAGETLVVLDEARTIAGAADEVWAGTEHVLTALCQSGVSTAGLLQRRGITPAAMADALANRALSSKMTTRDLVAQARAGEILPIYFRENLLRDLLNLLSRADLRNVLLIGPAGAGKRSLVYGLAQLIAEGKGPVGLKSVIEIAETAFLDQPVQAIQAGLRQAANGILFIPNIHRFFGGLAKADFPPAAANALQKTLLDDSVALIGTTTEADYATRLATNSSVAERSQVLRVPPASVEETTMILTALRPRLESDYALALADEALKTAARLAARYLTTEVLPGAAVHLINRACALVRMSLQKDLAFQPTMVADSRVDADDVALAVSQMTGIPVSKLGQDERSRYAGMVEYLRQRIVGQDDAVLAVSRAVKTARVGLKDPKRPIGSFLFLGPTGVGKTELARTLAEFLFGSEDNMIALDMTEYQEEASVNRLIGAPPGYVGYEGGGQLTDKVRTQPYSIVLFDEVEKAHPRVLDVLLQVMEEGRLTDGQGRLTSFSETVIILTSNFGSEYLSNPNLNWADARELAMEKVKAGFRPEFLNRLDDIIFFNPLTPDDLSRILGLLVAKESQLAAGRGLTLSVTEAARQWLLAQNDHPEWGARPLRRILQRNIREPLADFLLHEDPKAGATVQIDMVDGKLTFTNTGSTGAGS